MNVLLTMFQTRRFLGSLAISLQLTTNLEQTWR